MPHLNSRDEQMRLSEYILLPREVRKRHLDLTTPCVLNEGCIGAKRKRGKKALLALLRIENDVPNWVEAKIQVCHSCDCHSANGWCENPLHLSIGTAKENQSDISPEAQRKGGQRAAELKVGIHDPAVKEKTNRQMRKKVELTRVATGETFVFHGLKVAARELGLDSRTLSEVCLGRKRTTRGYTARHL